METPNVETLNEVKEQIAARFDRVTKEGSVAAREGTEALTKAYQAQCATGQEFLRKSADLLDDLRQVDVPRRLRTLGDAAAATARKSADTWLELAETSLGRARRLLQAVIEDRPNAA